MKLEKNTKRALWVILGWLALIFIAGIVVGSLTANAWWGLLASVGAIFLGLFVLVFSVIIIAAGRVLSGMEDVGRKN